MSSKSNESAQARVVARNRSARHEYEILEELECGIVLHGSEVKSIRDHKMGIEEAHVRVKDGEVWLVNADIAEYPQATYLNHERRRTRKLLLNKAQIRKFASKGDDRGLTIIPLDVHFSERGIVKLTIALARGRKAHDKREKLKLQSDRREMQLAKQKTIRPVQGRGRGVS